MDVSDFLRDLGLEQYEAAFQHNGIDIWILPKLTPEDLKDLGVAMVGHRRLLLEAIAALHEPTAPAVTAGADTVDAAPMRGTQASSITEAERRPLSVMFCDLIGSTALSSRLDPEDLREVFRAYQTCVATTIQQFDGFIARYVGDGVLIYFGWPEARETDAERAVRAGLAVVAAISAQLVGGKPMQVRVGIATGLVVIGEPIGSGDSRQQTAVGETPNVAARLQGLAGPNQVVIDTATRRQIGGLFECQDLGTVELKGLPMAVPAWQVLGEGLIGSRFEALRPGTTPLVGRDEEMELLLRRWSHAKAGNGRVVLISAEPGVGKSRLAEALAERIGDEPHTRLRYFCSPHHQDSALYPVIAQMERAADLAHVDGPAARLAKLRALLSTTAPPIGDVALIAELHSLPLADLAPPLDLTPQRKKERTFEALLRQIEAFSRQQPVLMIFDDLHWIDPSSCELLDRVTERVVNWPILLLATFRPEFQPPWTGQPHVTTLTLSRLDRRDTAAMVANVARNITLPMEIVQEIADRADGVPLFIEELTKVVLESGTQSSTALSVAPHPIPTIPATLHASLVARLDRLGRTAKELAQKGAVIGRQFSYELLAPIADLSEQQLREALEQLTHSGLLFVQSVAPQSIYTFKHALVQDAAYGTLLRNQRQQLHAGVAAVLEQRFPEIVIAQPELLAHHATEAGLAERAIRYWRRAGERAAERSANSEAIAHLTRGLELLKTLPESPQRDEQELAFQDALVSPLQVSRGFGSVEAEHAAARALELCRRSAADTPALFRALHGLWFVYHIRAELLIARDLGEQLLDLARRVQDPELLGYAHFGMGDTLFWFGELISARAHLEQGIALYDPEWDRSSAFRYGFNCNSNCHLFLGRVLWHLGYPDQALTFSERAVAIAGSVAHPLSLAVALSWSAALHQLRGEVGRTLKAADAGLAFANEQFVIPFFGAQAMILRGWALVEQGQQGKGLAELHQGLTTYRSTGAELERSHWLGLMAEACGKARQIEDGLRVVSEALSEIDRNGVRYYEAELHRVEGKLLLRLASPDEYRAEESFRRAIGMARAQNAKSFELRASTSLARLWRHQGKRAEARDLLDPVYNWFTEGFGTKDLQEAKSLLAELG
jgi:class 3 adenylate cyclase/predicted ATPase